MTHGKLILQFIASIVCSIILGNFSNLEVAKFLHEHLRSQCPIRLLIYFFIGYL